MGPNLIPLFIKISSYWWIKYNSKLALISLNNSLNNIKQLIQKVVILFQIV